MFKFEKFLIKLVLVSFNLGKIIIFAEIKDNTGNGDRYRPTPSKMAEEGKKKYTLGSKKGISYIHDYSEILDKKYTIEERVGTGSPGQWPGQGDTINELPIEYGAYDTLTKDAKYNDLVKFRFEAVDTSNPDNSNIIAFRAFLDNFGDDYSANWNSFKYNGRGEDFYTYGGFKRTFSFSFKIAAQSRGEMQPLYTKLNYLASNLAPEYSTNGRMRAPYIKLTIGHYMNRTPGFLTSMNIKWQKNYPWEIMITPDLKVDKNMRELPQVLDVSCQFTPIHNFVPRKSVRNSPFIIPEDYIMGGGLDSKEIMSSQPNQSVTDALTNKDISQELQDDVNQMIINDKENIYNGTNVTTFAAVSTAVNSNIVIPESIEVLNNNDTFDINDPNYYQK